MFNESSHINGQIILFGLQNSENLSIKSDLESAGIQVLLLHSNGQDKEWLKNYHPDLILFDPSWELSRKERWREQMEEIASEMGVPFLPTSHRENVETLVEDPRLPHSAYHFPIVHSIKYQLVRSQEQKRVEKFQQRLVGGARKSGAEADQYDESMLFFDQLFLNSSISTIVFDTEGWALRVNDRFTEIFGIEREQIEGKKFNLFQDEALIQQGFIAPLKRVFDEKIKGEWDIVYDIGLSAKSQNLQVKEQVVKPFRTWAFPITDKSGKLMHVVFQHLDNSDLDRKDSKIQLHEQILNNLAEGVSLTRSADNKIVFTNPTFDRIFGYESGELLEKHVSCLNGSDDESAEAVADKIIQSLRNHGYWNGELLNVRKDGSQFWSIANVTSFDHPEYGLVWVTVQQDITNRIEAEKALRKAELENRAVLNTFPYVLFRVNRDGRIFDFRAPDSALLYASPEKFLGKTFPEVMPVELGRKLVNHLTEAFETGRVINIEYTIPLNDTEHYFEGRFIPISDKEVLLFAHDVSSSKHAEELIRISEERYNLVIQASKDGVWDWDMNKDIAYVSPRWCEIMGTPMNNNLVRSPLKLWVQRIHADQRAEVQTKLFHHVETAKPFEVDYLYEIRPNEFLWRRTVGQAILGRDGKPHRMVGLSIDIDERKRFELQLGQSIKEVSDYKKALDQAAIVSISDIVGTILYVNQKFCEQYGYTPEEVLGRNHKLLNSGVHPREFWQHFWSEISQGRVLKAEVCNKGKNGDLHWSDTTIVPLLNEEGKPYQFLAIRNDITQKRKLEKDLAEQQLRQQKVITEVALQEQEKERNELGRELHDNINQILATAKIYLGMARSKDGDVDSLLTHSFTHLNSAIEEIRRLSHNLVAPTLGDIGLHAALQTLLLDADKTDLFEIQFEDEVKDFSLLGNKGELMLYRIIQEQLNNIRKHAKAKKVLLKLYLEAGDLNLSIIDDGVGFDKARKLSGIGLSNIQNRVTFYSGSMRYETSPGNGFALHIRIPFTAPQTKVE